MIMGPFELVGLYLLYLDTMCSTGNFLLDKLDAYDSAVGEANTRGALLLKPCLQPFKQFLVIQLFWSLDLAYKSI